MFACSSKFGLLQFGSDKVVERFKSDSVAWENAFDEDDDELINGTQFAETEEEEDYDTLNHLRAALVPKKLPAVVELMSYEELWKYITQETIKEHWREGGKSKCVKFGHPEFAPSFWLEDVWGWDCVNKHPKDLTRASYTGPGNMTSYLKKVLVNKLDKLGINPAEWISKHFTETEKQ